MHSYENLRKQVENFLKTIRVGKEPPELYDPINYILGLGGKRLRPVMLLMACEMYDNDFRKALEPAMSIEIFHNFTLVHDDIMDRAPIRRGKPTIYKKWNADIAILAGDTMFAIACSHLSGIDPSYLPEVLKEFTKTAAQVCEGQQFDMNFETSKQVSIPDYLEMIRLKTAVLFASSLKIGAMIGKAPEEEALKLYHFGENLGLAFQLTDDLLDVYAEKEKFGKIRGGDIAINKKTYLYLKAMELAHGNTLQKLATLFGEQETALEDKISAVVDIYDQLKIRQITEERIGNYYKTALTWLDSLELDQQKTAPLRELGKLVINRDY